MQKKDSGDFEVLLGNKQLLSIFFIVVILLGVFFTMGYIAGRGSSGSGDAAKQAKKEALRTGPPPVERSEPAAFSYAPPQSTEAPPTGVTPPAPPPEATEPEAGRSYLQVAAVKKPDADLVADVLKRKGFQCLVAPHPTEPVFRVLVGPLDDADAIAKARAALTELRFTQLILRKF